MLKQQKLFDKLVSKNVNPTVYALMLRHYDKVELTSEHIGILKSKLPTGFIEADDSLSPKAIKLIKECELLFKATTKVKAIDLLGPDFLSKIEDFLSMFPTQKLPSGKYARGNKKGIEQNFLWFFQEYEYSWETILKATAQYINEYERKNYLYMRTAFYFIKKETTSHNIDSELANYCDMVESNTDFTEERIFKQKVV